VQLYRPCGMASVLPTCRNMSISRRRGGKRAALTSVCSCEARPSNIARGTKHVVDELPLWPPSAPMWLWGN